MNATVYCLSQSIFSDLNISSQCRRVHIGKCIITPFVVDASEIVFDNAIDAKKTTITLGLKGNLKMYQNIFCCFHHNSLS